MSTSTSTAVDTKQVEAGLHNIALRLEAVSDMIDAGTKQMLAYVETQEKIKQDIAPFKKAFTLK